MLLLLWELMSYEIIIIILSETCASFYTEDQNRRSLTVGLIIMVLAVQYSVLCVPNQSPF